MGSLNAPTFLSHPGQQTNHISHPARIAHTFVLSAKDNYHKGDDDEENVDIDENDIDENETFSISNDELQSDLKWAGALSSLRSRIEEVKSGKPSGATALYSLMTASPPSEMINNFVVSSSPTVINAMTDAVGALIGNLGSNPALGMSVNVEATGERLAALCFQLQMTGYMFRNAEYVLALKEVMRIGSHSVAEYKKAFDRIDSDSNGYIDAGEIGALLKDVYGEAPPEFEISTFLKFFDSNLDGKISWSEFEKGLGVVGGGEASSSSSSLLLGAGDNEDDNDNIASDLRPQVSGKLRVELEGGKVVDVDAQDYLRGLKAEAQALRDAIGREGGGGGGDGGLVSEEKGGLGGYLSSLPKENVMALTEGITDDVVTSMQMLVNYVLEGGPSNAGKVGKEDSVEMPAGALRQLGLWQLVLGYRLREEEAKGEYKGRLN